MMNKKMYWKELTDDGLLKEPKELDPYGHHLINNYGGFDSEEEAVEHLDNIKDVHNFNIYGDYILVTIYCT